MKVGCHISISPSLLINLKYAISIGATSAQIFLGNNISSSLKTKYKFTTQEKIKIKTYLKKHNFYLSIHAIYLINFCSFPPESNRIKYAQTNLIYDLSIGNLIGAKCVVVHIGVKKDLNINEAFQNMANNILFVLSRTKQSKNIKLLLETSAGQGTQIAVQLPDLSKLWNIILTNSNKYNLTPNEVKLKCGFCIDTAHIFSAGYPIRMVKGMNNYLDEFDRLIGLKHVELIHLNDSKKDLGSLRDVHEGIGDGYIFGIDKIKSSIYPIPITQNDYLQNLITLLSRCKKNKIPALILETHKACSENINDDLYIQEIYMLNSLINNKNWIKKNLHWKLIHTNNKSKLKSINNKSKLKSITNKSKLQSRTNKSKLQSINKNTKSRTSKNIKNENINTNNLILYPTNIIIINKLKLIRDYYKKIENDTFRVLAYSKAILALKNYNKEIINSNQLNSVKSIGPKIIKKIDEYLTTGEMNIFKERDLLLKLDNYNKKEKTQINYILGFGNKRVNQLKELNIYTYYDLLNAVKLNKITLNNKEEIGVKYHLHLIKMIPRSESEQIFKKINTILKNKLNIIFSKYNLFVELAGSYPSGKIESKDVDLLILSNKIKNKLELKQIGKTILQELINKMKELGILIEVLSFGYNMIMCLVKVNKYIRHLDIRLLPKKNEIFARLFFTSGGDFNKIMRQNAKNLGMKLNEMDLTYIQTNKSVFSESQLNKLTEKDIFDKLKLTFIPMNKRR